jgi:peptidoglycan/LPS O-acetylase OafA/YrhL
MGMGCFMSMGSRDGITPTEIAIQESLRGFERLAEPCRAGYAVSHAAQAALPVRAGATKDLPLEGIRGVAALSVVFWHSLLGFYPAASGEFSIFPNEASLAGEPWFGLVYGASAVTLFFVLSGYVLTRGYFRTFDPRQLVRGAVKRWPRLLAPVLAAVLASYALYALRAYRFEAAAKVTQSPWLANFGSYAPIDFTPGFLDALRQGALRVFFVGDSYYNSSLWTARFELYGSYLAFGVAAVIGLLRGGSKLGVSLAVAMAVILLTIFAPAYAPFLAGVGIAYVEGLVALPTHVSVGAIAISIYVFGYSGKPWGAFAWLSGVFGIRLQSSISWQAFSPLRRSNSLLPICAPCFRAASLDSSCSAPLE